MQASRPFLVGGDPPAGSGALVRAAAVGHNRVIGRATGRSRAERSKPCPAPRLAETGLPAAGPPAQEDARRNGIRPSIHRFDRPRSQHHDRTHAPDVVWQIG